MTYFPKLLMISIQKPIYLQATRV